MDWRSIEEPEEVVVLKGVLAADPRAYETYYGRRLRRSFRDRVIAGLRSFTSFSFSAIMHALILVLLAEIVILARPIVEETIVAVGLNAPREKAPIDKPGDSDKKTEEPSKAERPKESKEVKDDSSTADGERSDSIGHATESVNVAPATTGVVDASSDIPFDDLAHLTGTGLFDGRGESGRRASVTKFGGNAASEEAVERGLEWLAAHQDDDGKWSSAFQQHCTTPKKCRMPGSSGPCPTTGFALMAFLGAGYSHKLPSKYQNVVKKAIEFLMRQQDKDGYWAADGMYANGVVAYAMGEALAFTRDPDLVPVLDRAVAAIARSQDREGGWYYDPVTDSHEFTCSVWNMMALRSAMRAGVTVPEKTVDKLKRFLRKSQSSNGGFHYQLPRGGETLGCTAAGLFASIMFEVADDKLIEKGLRYCDQYSDALPDVTRTRDFEYIYYWYYRTMVSFQVQGREWTKWNNKIRQYLISRQHKDGHEKGSWSIIDYNNCGRVYSTSLAVICLEVYYRYMPVYRNATSSVIADATDDSTREETPEERRLAKERMTREDREKADEDDRNAGIKDALQRLESKNSFDRYLGARRLSELGVKEAWEKMVAATDKETGNIRAVMIVYVGRLKNEDAVPWLMRQLDDSDEKIRAAAMDGLMHCTGVYITEPARWKAWYKDRQAKSTRK